MTVTFMIRSFVPKHPVVPAASGGDDRIRA